jgi:hypothetical protein
MDVVKPLKSQYHATLTMLENAIKTCPDTLWAAAKYKNRFWHIAFHTLFYTHLYLHDGEQAFEAWEKHLEKYENLKYRSDKFPEDKAVYSQTELLDYVALCKNRVDSYLPTVKFDEPSGFSWLPFDKLELHLYNVRHAQHHTGQLGDRLRELENTGVRWVGKA